MLRFRGGLVFKAHRLMYHSTLGLRVKRERETRQIEVGEKREFSQDFAEGLELALPAQEVASKRQTPQRLHPPQSCGGRGNLTTFQRVTNPRHRTPHNLQDTRHKTQDTTNNIQERLELALAAQEVASKRQTRERLHPPKPCGGTPVSLAKETAT